MATPSKDSVGLTEDDVLRLAKLFEEMVATKPWKEFLAVLEQHVESRRNLVVQPLHNISNADLEGVSAETKLYVVEAIKGAIIGLGIAMRLPYDTINAAADIRAERKKESE